MHPSETPVSLSYVVIQWIPFEPRARPSVVLGALLQDLPANSLIEIQVWRLQPVICPPCLALSEWRAFLFPALPALCSTAAVKIVSLQATTDVIRLEIANDQPRVSMLTARGLG